MSDMAPSGPMPVLKTEPGGMITHGSDIHNSLIEVGHLSSVVVGLNGNSNGGGMMMPTIINDDSISAPASPMGSGMNQGRILGMARNRGIIISVY